MYHEAVTKEGTSIQRRTNERPRASARVKTLRLRDMLRYGTLRYSGRGARTHFVDSSPAQGGLEGTMKREGGSDEEEEFDAQGLRSRSR